MSVIKRIPKTIGCLLARRFVKRIHGRQMHIADGKSFTVNLVSSWDKQCGIATYSAFLAEELRKKAKLSVTPLPQRNPLSPFFFVLGRSVGRSGDVVQVEFEYGLFSSLKLGKKSLTAFASLPFYLGLSYGNRRVVTTIHEPREVVSANRRSGLFYTKLVDKLIFAVSDQIIVHTQKSKQLLETVYGVSEGKLTVIPHGSYQKPLFLDKEECKRKLGLSGKTIVTIMGFVTPKKGHDILIPLLPKLDPNVQLVIAGGPQTVSDEQFLEMLKQLVEQNHCSDRVTFTGYLEDLSTVINATDIAVLPYRFVTDSGILHMLVSYHVPILASDLESFREAYEQFSCLELFKSENHPDLLRKIQALLSDEQLRATLSAKCEVMWNATKWSAVAQRHMEVYREVVSANAC